MPQNGIRPCYCGLQVQGTANSPPSAVGLFYLMMMKNARGFYDKMKSEK